MDSKQDTQKFYREFISTYKANPQLWDPNHEDYKNKFRRNLGNEELYRIIKKYDPNASRYSVRQKVNCLRSNYRKDLRRHLKSRRILPNGEEQYEYVPLGWKFYALQFLNAGFMEEEVSTLEVVQEDQVSNDAASGEEMDVIEPSIEDTYNSNEGENEQETVNELKVPRHYTKRKYITEQEYTRLLNKLAIGREFEAIGTTVAYKLKRMDETQRYYAELLINKVLINGLKNNLSDETDLTELQVLDVKNFDE